MQTLATYLPYYTLLERSANSDNRAHDITIVSTLHKIARNSHKTEHSRGEGKPVNLHSFAKRINSYKGGGYFAKF